MAFAVVREVTMVKFLRINWRDKILRIISTEHAVLMNIVERVTFDGNSCIEFVSVDKILCKYNGQVY